MNSPGEIKIYLVCPRQMFFDEDGLYRKRKIRKDAEEFIMEEAKAFPRKTPIKISIYLPAGMAIKKEGFVSSIHRHFAYCKAKTGRERKRALQHGWRILVIAFVILGIALSLSHMLSNLFPHNSIAGTAVESLNILGWVAFWKPVELLLYDWYPFSRDMVLYTRLEQSEVLVANTSQ
jgi:hypothetical protein